MITLEALTPEAREKFTLLLARCEHRGDELRPYCAVRDPFAQARLWRQSRTAGEIATECTRLRAAGAPRIAACIESVGPQHGKWATNAVPGLSWHQHGEAMDCFLMLSGRAVWDASLHGYQAFVTEALGLGLTPGAKFRTPDTNHVQLRKDEPHYLYEIARIDNMMAARFPQFAALGKGA